MKPGTYELVIYQGSDLDLTFIYKIEGEVVDLSSYSARAQGRTSFAEDDVVFSATEGSGLTLGINGTIRLQLTAAVTAAMDFSRGRWDLELVDGSGKVTRLLQGPLKLSREVTR